MQKGHLKKWNDEKGFGFIRPENSNEDIFFHISSLQNTVRRPVLDDLVYFNIETDEKGRRKAVQVSIEGVKSQFDEKNFSYKNDKRPQYRPPKTYVNRAQNYQAQKNAKHLILNISASMVILLVVLAGFDQFNKSNSVSDSTNVSPKLLATEEVMDSNQFKCAGKTRCSQMSSCAEAMYYLNHCPGTVTDGDGDGLPCEDQWWGH